MNLPSRATAALTAVTGVLALAGCASSTGGLSAPSSEYGSPQAEMAVRRFLDAAAEENYVAMGQQFGTRNGPAEERLGITEVEQRMMVLSSMLAHDEYDLRKADLAQVGPHRTRFVADMTGTRQGRVSVPIVAARTGDGRWFVERVDTDPLTRTGGP